MSKTKAQPTYSSAIKELQQIVVELQDDTASMDDLSAKVKRAAELIKFCREKLRSTEDDVERLLGDLR